MIFKIESWTSENEGKPLQKINITQVRRVSDFQVSISLRKRSLDNRTTIFNEMKRLMTETDGLGKNGSPSKILDSIFKIHFLSESFKWARLRLFFCLIGKIWKLNFQITLTPLITFFHELPCKKKSSFFFVFYSSFFFCHRVFLRVLTPTTGTRPISYHIVLRIWFAFTMLWKQIHLCTLFWNMLSTFFSFHI